MSKGQSFLSNNEKTLSGDEKRHLRIVITDADQDMNQVVVTIRTLRGRGLDTSCIIRKGEHKFIKHDSVVDFSRTIVMSYVEIYNGLKQGLLIDKGDISKELLIKIQNAARSSNRIPQNIKEMFINF